VAPLSFRLLSGSGAPVALPVPPGAAQVLRVALPPDLREGGYTLSFRVTSLDSHPVGGSIAFIVGEGSAAPPVAKERDTMRGWRIALRALRDLAVLIAAGGALFLMALGRFPGDRRLLVVAALVAGIAALLGTSLQGAAMLGPEAMPWGPQAWQAGIRSSFGMSAGVALGGVALIAAGALARNDPPRLLLALGALAAVASFPLTGHAAGARPGMLGPFALAVHVLAAAFWAGSLCALLARPAPVLLRRFSRLGVVAVAILVGGGVAFALLELRSLADVTGSEYGRLLIGKAMLLAGLLVLASLNRLRFLPSLERGEASAAPKLRRSIAGELALVGCVMALTALLVQTPPPRDAGFVQTLQAAGRSAQLSVTPARAGHNRFSVRFDAFDPAAVAVIVSNAAAGVEPEPRSMQRESPGHYTREGAELVVPGTWTVEVRARIGDFDQVVFRAEVPVR
jgi:copper transport protein